VTVQGGVVDPIGIFVFARDATGIEHVFVGDGAEGRFGFFSSDGFVGEGAGGDETAEVGGVVEEGGGAEGSVGGGGGCVFWEGAVVGEVEEVGDVDYNGVANLNEEDFWRKIRQVSHGGVRVLFVDPCLLQIGFNHR